MKSIKLGQKFTHWEVVDSEVVRIGRKKHVLCYDAEYDVLTYVDKYSLLKGASKGSLLRSSTRNHSTRYKHFSLPKYVYRYDISNSKKKYRVLYKEPMSNNVKTFFYFYNLEDAVSFSEILHS